MIAGNEPETTLTNNTSSVSTQINPLVDLAIVKTAAPSPVIAGNQLTYTLTASNNGPSDATGVSIADTLPAGVTYVSASSSQGTVSQTNGTVNVNLGSLAHGATATVTILVTVSPSARGTITNTAVIAGNEPETTLANNTSSVSTQINPLVDLAIVKTAAPNPVAAGGLLTYTLTVMNRGPSDATGVTILDTLPTGVTYVSASSSQGTTNQANGTVTVNVGNMAYGTTATVTIVVVVAPSTLGDITNTAVVSGNESDDDLTNNTGSVMTLLSSPPSSPPKTQPLPGLSKEELHDLSRTRAADKAEQDRQPSYPTFLTKLCGGTSQPRYGRGFGRGFSACNERRILTTFLLALPPTPSSRSREMLPARAARKPRTGIRRRSRNTSPRRSVDW